MGALTAGAPQWEMGMAGWARSLHGKQLLGATGSAHRLWAF